jgi:hypothetical protein
MRRVALAVVLAALAVAQPAGAAESPITARDELVGGRDLASWQIAWNRWRLALPAMPAGIGRGCITADQRGPVWFLSGGGSSFDEHVVTIDCTVPAGSYLMTGLPETLCPDVLTDDPRLKTPRSLERCARRGWLDVGDRHPRLVLDGRAIPNGYVVYTGVFRFTMPARGNVFQRVGIRGGRAAAGAKVAIVKPLAPGHHTLIEGVKYANFHNQVTIFNLTVV